MVEGVAEAGVEAGRDGGERSAEVDGARGAEVDGAAGRGAREVAGAGVAGGAGGAAVVGAALGAERGVERIGDGAGELVCHEAADQPAGRIQDGAEEAAARANVECVGADDELIWRYRDGDLLSRRGADIELNDCADRQRVCLQRDLAGRADHANGDCLVEAEADVSDDLVRSPALNIDLVGVDTDLELASGRAVVADVRGLGADVGRSNDAGIECCRRQAEGDAARGAGGCAAGAAEETTGEGADVVTKEVEAALGHVDLSALGNLRCVVGVDKEGRVRIDGCAATTTAAATAATTAATTSAATAATASTGIHRSHYKEQQELTTDRTRDQSTHSSSNFNEAQGPAPKSIPRNLFNLPPWGGEVSR